MCVRCCKDQLTDIGDVVPLHDDVSAEVTWNNKRRHVTIDHHRARLIYTCAPFILPFIHIRKIRAQNYKAFIIPRIYLLHNI